MLGVAAHRWRSIGVGLAGAALGVAFYARVNAPALLLFLLPYAALRGPLDWRYLWLPAGLAAVVALAIGALILLWRRPTSWWVGPLWFGAVFAYLEVLSQVPFTTISEKTERYITMLGPPLAVTVAMGVVAVARLGGGRYPAFLAAGAALVLLPTQVVPPSWSRRSTSRVSRQPRPRDRTPLRDGCATTWPPIRAAEPPSRAGPAPAPTSAFHARPARRPRRLAARLLRRTRLGRPGRQRQRARRRVERPGGAGIVVLRRARRGVDPGSLPRQRRRLVAGHRRDARRPTLRHRRRAGDRAARPPTSGPGGAPVTAPRPPR